VTQTLTERPVTGETAPESAPAPSPSTHLHPGAGTAWISWLRIVAIAGVVTIHTVGGTAAMPGARETWRGQLAIVADIGAIFAVPVFVMISGALTLDPSRYTGPAAFLRQRALRIVPPLVFWHAWYLGIVLWIRDQPLTVQQTARLIMNGQLFTALYFFWVVLGLSLVSPVLIPFLSSVGRRGAVVAGLAAAAVPALSISTMGLRRAPVALMDSAWTLWLPYLGVFLLGWGLRGVVLRGPALVATGLGTLAMGLLLAWQWRNPAAPGWLQTLNPVSYYGFGAMAYSCGVFLVAHSLVRPGGALAIASRPRAVRLGRLLGDATLGVFALHLTIVTLLLRLPMIGGAPASPTGLEMVARVVVVLLVTYPLVLVLRRVPYVRALL
jgi:surface polysaccharide O-acyltransferase-like enzyme